MGVMAAVGPMDDPILVAGPSLMTAPPAIAGRR